MSKYKNVNEGLVDKFISALFDKVAKGLESKTINKLKKTDPKLAKQFQKLQDTKKEIEKMLSKQDLKKIRNNEIPDIFYQ
tara:strand:- start:947 stop:1186 length:240 start_codon:yes stop_codon:yes gene_type:complete